MTIPQAGTLMDEHTESILGEARGKQASETEVNAGEDPGGGLDSVEAETPSTVAKTEDDES
jgi:hypothetical protein